MAGRPSPIPYCGTPPSPAELAGRWNLDPVLIACLIAIAAAYLWAARRTGVERGRVGCFAVGWAITAAALVSPLCPLSVSLFAARVGQHMGLTLVAAPLVALGRPFDVFRALAPGGPIGSPSPGPEASKTPIVAAGLYAVLLWCWHTPIPYEFTFESTVAYWLMHLTLFGAALWLWTALLVPSRPSPFWAIGAGLFSTVQMGFLGALITLAPHAIFTPHLLTTYAWGLTPLQDQQIGGALMWVPGCVAFLGAAMYELWRVIEARPARPMPVQAPV
ncbi:MAG TPA: cytochrome c oxidase assembly protein [Caulobacteraceae bacterium]|jgi:putative membrane protein|nr:cytochrome c oxidase assembly protein [Caulobacteraceae bacterium]